MLKALIEPAPQQQPVSQPTVLSQSGTVASLPPTTASYPPQASQTDPTSAHTFAPLRTVTILLGILVGMLGLGGLTAGLLYFQPWQNQQTQNGTPSSREANTEQLEQENAQLEAEKERMEAEARQRRLEAEKQELQAEIDRQREEASRPSSPSLPYRSSCGSPRGSGSVWYGVVGDRRALSTVKSNYCGDALIMGGNTQAASFTSRSQAQEFANTLTEVTGYSFWVKEPKSVSVAPPVSRPKSSTSLSKRSTCGSPYVAGATWYAVVGDRRALSTVKSNYCGDALIVGGNVQAASFTSRSEAERFANALSSVTGYSFWVKDP